MRVRPAVPGVPTTPKSETGALRGPAQPAGPYMTLAPWPASPAEMVGVAEPSAAGGAGRTSPSAASHPHAPAYP